MKKLFQIMQLFLCLLISTNIYSQDISDSLMSLLKSTKDTNRINILNKLGNYYSERDSKLSNKYSKEAISLSEKLHFFKGKAVALNNIGIVYDVIGNYDSALYNYNVALKIAKKIQIKELIANISSNIGLIYWNQGEYEKALKTYFYSLKIFEQIKNKKGLSNVYSNIGLINYDLKNYKEAWKYHFQSLKLREEMKDLYGIGVSLTNIGLIYMDLDSAEMAIKYFKKSVEYKIKTNDLYGLSVSYGNLGTVYESINNKEALRYQLLALPIRLKLNDEFGLITNYNSLTYIYRQNGDAKKALYYAFKGLKLAEKIQSKTKLEKVYQIIALLYKDKRDFEKSLIYFKKYDSIKALIYSVESAKSINEMQTKYETEKKEHQLKLKSVEAKNQRNRNKVQILIFLGVVSIIIFISIFSFYRYKQIHKAQQIIEKGQQEKILFKAVMDSEGKERKRIAQELHDGLGQLLCTAKMNISSLDDVVLKSDNEDIAAFNNSIELLDEAVAEVRNISHNLMPNALIDIGLVPAITELVKKINSAGKLKVDLKCTDDIIKLDETEAIAVYRIIQEVLNNTIRHSEAKNVEIEFYQSEKKLILNISDDGKGMDVSKIKESKGIGWKNIYSRVSMLNGKIEIISEIGKGTKLFIDLEIIS